MAKTKQPAPPITIATFDIETSNLNADFGIVLCAVIKPAYQAKPIILRGDKYPNWATKRSDDSALVRDIASTLENYSVLIAHNGLWFDLPFIRTRMLKFGQTPLRDIKIVDPVQIGRSKLRMSSNSLARMAEHTGCGGKTQVHGDQWLKAALDGDRRAMNYIVDHCVKDVESLEELAGKVSPYCKQINDWGSGR